MARPAVRFGRFDRGASMHVDYKDVLEQAVKNERIRAATEIRNRIAEVPVEATRGGYGNQRRPVDDVVSDIIAVIDKLIVEG